MSEQDPEETAPERKATEAALRRSEARFRALVEHGSDIIAVLGEDGTIQYQSPSVERIMGRPAGTLYGENVFEMVHPDDREALRADFARCLQRSGEPISTQFRMKHADGSWVPLEAVGRNLLDDPDVAGVIVNSRDISARREARAALSRRLELEKTVARVSEELLTEPVDLSAVVAMLGKGVGADRAYLSKVDETRQTLTSEYDWNAPGVDPVTADGRALCLDDFAWWREALRGRESLSLLVADLPPEAAAERRFYRKHGIVSLLDVPLRLSDGTLFGFIGYSAGTARPWAPADVRLLRVVSTLLAGHFERKEHDEALRQSERRFRNVVENARDVIFQTDAEGRWTLLSPSWEEITGYTVAESLGTRYTDYMPQADTVPAYRERVVDAHDMAEDLVRYRTKAGASRWFHISSRVLRGEDGAILGGTGTLTDVTDTMRFESEREARRRAEELLETKTSFLNAMSHELRTPLASILGFADVLVEEGEGQRKEFAEHIANSGKRLRKTLDSVLRLAQLDGEGVELDLQAMNLSEAVRDMTTLLGITAREEGLSFEVETPQDALFAALDEGTLYRILDNLVSNAIKFTDAGGITVRVEGRAEEARIHVEDTGIGIGEAFQSRLFEDFAQESAGRSRTHEGSGLGLAITRRLVRLMGGSIRVESERGKGTVFTVTFARLPPEPASLPENEQEPEASAAPSSEAVPRSVLLVEDNKTMRHLTTHILEEHYHLTAACGFDEALTLAREGSAAAPFDLLLLDIDLGEGAARSGTHLLQQLRQTSACAGAPAMALTAYAMPDDGDHFLEAGFDRYMAKPFTKDELLRNTARTISSKQAPSPTAERPGG